MSYVGNALQLTPVNTQILVPAGGSSFVYLGTAVPTGTANGVYSQNIIILNIC